MKMRKFHVLGLALVAVCAMGVLSASASALTFLLAEWLENGNRLTETLLAEISGELTLKETITILGVKTEIEALCSGILDGDIGEDGADDITELLNLKEEAISLTGLSGLAISCTNTKNCGEPLAWALNLPWLTLLVLMEDGTETFFADLLTNAGKNVGYEVECMTQGISDSCLVTEAAALVENEGSTPNVEFSDPFTELAGLKLASCELAGNEAGIVSGLGNLKGDGTGTLTASE